MAIVALMCATSLMNVVDTVPAGATSFSWSPQEISLGSGFLSAGLFQGISCTSATACTAVGYDGNNQPIVLSGNPSSWTASDATEIALGSSFASSGALQAVSCTSATSCTAVGNDGNNQPIVLSGDPSSWTASNATEVTLGSGFGSSGNLFGVSCSSATACTAAGYDGLGQPWTLTGNPSSWTVSNATQITLGSGFGSAGYPTAISCTSATSCTVVGYDNNNLPLVLTGNPSSWTTSNATEVALGAGFSSSGYLNGISCTSATACSAVGYDGNSKPLVLSGDPSSWTASNATEVNVGSSFGSYVELQAVSCSSATTCTAVAGDGHNQPFLISGDPSSWSASDASQVSLGSSFGSNGYLDGVSCTGATACIAVASDGNSEPLVLTGSAVIVLAPPVAYNVTYSLGGGTGTVPALRSGTAGTAFALPSGSLLSRVGYTFAGWSDGTSTYQSGATYAIGSSAVTLTAQWTAITNTVTYSLGGGIGAVPVQASEAGGATFTLPSGSSLSRVGYTFAGWSDGTSTYRSGASYAIGSSAVTLTAQWAADSIKSKVHPSCVVHFSNNSTQLTSTSRMILTKFATSLKSKGIASITIVGFADATGSSATNQALSLHRAQSVATSLRMEFKAVGLDSEKIRVVGGGVSTTSGTQGRNRKVVVSS